MKILVTGGAGFIGSHFIKYMVHQYPQHMIVNLDKLTYAGNLKTCQEIENYPNYQFIKGDICHKNFILQLFEKEKFDIVVHFAAETHVDRSIENPDVFIQTNVVGTSILLEASLQNGIQRFHQISTDEVYGDLPLNRKDLLFNENSPLSPSNPYSASKASADLLVLSYYRTYGLPVTISRCSNNFGSYQFPEKFIPLMTLQALHNQPLFLYGNGENVRDWIYVNDHCQAIDFILKYGKIGEIYHIGAHEEKSNIEVAQLILKIITHSQSSIQFIEDRKGHDLRYALDTTKLEALGWKSQYHFKEAIIDTIKWYQDHPEWWNDIYQK